jgi:hypothetical protein
MGTHTASFYQLFRMVLKRGFYVKEDKLIFKHVKTNCSGQCADARRDKESGK